MPSPYCVFGGEPIESPDGESLEGVGETRLTTGTIFTDKLFTGQREMAGLGIYHYGARFYSPKLGRFLSPDTIIPGAANPQAYNRYSYVLGNPLKYTDPTGHGQCHTQEDCEDIVDTPMRTGNPHNGGGSNNNANNGNPHDDDNDIDPNPNSLPAPDVTLPIPTQSSFQDILGRIAEFSFGAVLIGVGAIAVIGGGFIVGAAIVEVFAGVATGPLDALVVLHALAVGTVGTGFALVGVAGVFAGVKTMRDALTP